ncbi:MAG: DUF6316 family protein [Proteobacteria bacterium]|nr:DUF6316 family protein [Pseudomonadota bacterium]
MAKRKSDTDELLRFQTDRVYKSNNSYFVATREGVEVGPYKDRETAGRYGQQLIEILSKISDPEATLTAIRNFIFDTADYNPEFQSNTLVDYVVNE